MPLKARDRVTSQSTGKPDTHQRRIRSVDFQVLDHDGQKDDCTIFEMTAWAAFTSGS